ncbi:MAG: hypothetical protein A2Z29_11590 [Chloroflexi bacterium RBG_16_56_11]|nr:MAG: hypothetical protein A2Z29_11590 [Chloroflexi bacterium RBG_16_56_11]
MKRECVMITGSSRGLGRQLALVFARNNHDIILHGRDKEKLAIVREEVLRSGVDCDICSGDLGKNHTIEELCKVAFKKDVAVLINNAGTSSGSIEAAEHERKLPLDEIAVEQIDEILTTNLLAAIKLTKGIYPLFLSKKSGTIININSLLGREPRAFQSIYCASKWGLRGFTDSLRLEAANHNIRVIGVYLSRIKTKVYFTAGMEPENVARQVYAVYQSADASEVVLDGRGKP